VDPHRVFQSQFRKRKLFYEQEKYNVWTKRVTEKKEVKKKKNDTNDSSDNSEDTDNDDEDNLIMKDIGQLLI